MSSHPIASPHPTALPMRAASWHSLVAEDWDLNLVLGDLYPDVHQRGAVVAELESLTSLHHALSKQSPGNAHLARVEARIFQLFGVA